MALEPIDPSITDENNWVSAIDFFVNGMPSLQTINVKDEQMVNCTQYPTLSRKLNFLLILT